MLKMSEAENLGWQPFLESKILSCQPKKQTSSPKFFLLTSSNFKLLSKILASRRFRVVSQSVISFVSQSVSHSSGSQSASPPGSQSVSRQSVSHSVSESVKESER